MRTKEPKSARGWLRLVSLASLLILIPLLGLAACATTDQRVRQIPVPPILNPETVDDRMCMSNENAKDLGMYIIELQRCCEDD